MNLRSMKFRWGRWIAVAAGLLAAYAAMGFWLVPLVIKDQIPKLGQAELGREASVGEVKFNPFTLRLVAADLRLAGVDGAPLLEIGQLAVEPQWRSLIRRAWSFADIRITAPNAHLTIGPEGEINLVDLLDRLRRRPADRPNGTGLPRLIVERFALEHGKMDVRDQRTGHVSNIDPIDFALTDFSTLPDHNDAHALSAHSTQGGTLRWKGQASVNPLRGSGELTLENVSVPELATFFKSYTRLTVAQGQLTAALPYNFALADGKFDLNLAGASMSLRDTVMAREGDSGSFAALARLDVKDINVDLIGRQAAIGEVRAEGGKLTVKRDAKGELDLAKLRVAPAEPAADPPPGAAVVENKWKLGIKQVFLDQVSVNAVDETVSPPLKLGAGKVQLQLQLDAEQAGSALQLKLADVGFAIAGLTLASGAQTPVKLAQLGFTDGAFDLAERRAGVGRLYAEGGELQITRDRDGKLNLMGLLPNFAPSNRQTTSATSAASPGSPWIAAAKSVELSKFAAEVHDEESGVKANVSDLGLTLAGASSDMKRPVNFTASLNLREGGQLAAQGNVVPDGGALQADVRVGKLALAPLQPLLSKHVKLKIADGNVSAQGRLTTGAGNKAAPGVRYLGALDIAGLTLKEADGELFAAWKNVRADKVTATLSPNLLEIDDLRVVEANAKLLIEDDGSFNAARLLVDPAADTTAMGASAARAPAQASAKAADDPFPVRIRRVRIQNAKLDFSDLSLRPQFAAKIYELQGVVTGLSSSRSTRSRIELDGRVDEFGLARIRGELNPFAPRNNTDLNLVFRNIDMRTGTPYAMKFAGYRIAEGTMSLDLRYRVQNSQLEGANQIVIDKLTLGEKVDSPDALKLPLQLAIAILKDKDGRIDLGLPVSGSLDDPQFSWGALIWKAFTTLVTKIVSAPFRAFGGAGGEKLEAIDFDPGSARLLPPEREKIKQVVQLLDKRPQLKLSVPGQYSEQADGAALRARAVRVEISKRAGIKLEEGEEPGPVDLGSRAVRSAVRELYTARFGEAELDKQKKAAEAGTSDAKAEAAQQKLPAWQRFGKMIQGEPPVADSNPFYGKLLDRLNQSEPLPADALTKLGAQRAEAILAALKEAGIDPARAAAAAPENVVADAGKPVPLKLGLTAT